MKQKNFGKNLREMKKLPFKHVATGCSVYICMSYMKRLETTQQLSVVSVASNNKIMVHSWNWNDGAFQLDFHEAIQSKVQFKKRLFSHHSFGHSLFFMVWKKNFNLRPIFVVGIWDAWKKRSHQGAGPFSASVKFWTTTATKKQCEKETVASHRIETK